MHNKSGSQPESLWNHAHLLLPSTHHHRSHLILKRCLYWWTLRVATHQSPHRVNILVSISWLEYLVEKKHLRGEKKGSDRWVLIEVSKSEQVWSWRQPSCQAWQLPVGGEGERRGPRRSKAVRWGETARPTIAPRLSVDEPWHPTVISDVKCSLDLILRVSGLGFHCYFHSERPSESTLDGDHSVSAQCAASVSVPSWK